MVKMSTGLCSQLLDTGSLKSIFNLSFVDLYAGTVPATADASVGAATKIVRVSNASGGTGVTFNASAVAGVIAKNAGETWSGVNLATGTVTFFRHVLTADTAAASTTDPRIQGTVGTGGADMNLSSVALVSGATFTLNYYTQAFVPS